MRRIKGQKPPNNSSEPSSMAGIVVTVRGSTGIMLLDLGSDRSEQEDQRYNPETNAESDTFALALDGIFMNFTAHLEWIEQEVALFLPKNDQCEHECSGCPTAKERCNPSFDLTYEFNRKKHLGNCKHHPEKRPTFCCGHDNCTTAFFLNTWPAFSIFNQDAESRRS